MTQRARYWQELVAEWSASGQTQAAFCRQRRIRAGTFAWWRRRLRQTDPAGDGDPPVSVPEVSGRFVEVSRPAIGAIHFEVLLTGGRLVRVPAGFDAGELGRLLGVLERPC